MDRRGNMGVERVRLWGDGIRLGRVMLYDEVIDDFTRMIAFVVDRDVGGSSTRDRSQAALSQRLQDPGAWKVTIITRIPTMPTAQKTTPLTAGYH